MGSGVPRTLSLRRGGVHVLASRDRLQNGKPDAQS